MVEGQGHHFGPSAAVTPEDLKANWGTITDMSGARPFPSAMEAIGAVFAGLPKA